MGATFGKGIPWLGGVLAGYLIGSIGDKFEGNYDLAQKFRNAGKVLSDGFLCRIPFRGWMLKAIVYLAGQFNRPLPFLIVMRNFGDGFMLRLLSRQEIASALHAKASHNEAISGFLFLSPNLLGLPVLLCRTVVAFVVCELHEFRLIWHARLGWGGQLCKDCQFDSGEAGY